ncbi:hypothetical protein GCM10010417_47890 [Streptomyces carpaticus]
MAGGVHECGELEQGPGEAGGVGFVDNVEGDEQRGGHGVSVAPGVRVLGQKVFEPAVRVSEAGEVVGGSAAFVDLVGGGVPEGER